MSTRPPHEPEIVDYGPSRREQMLERPLPHSADAERAILGGCIIENKLIADIRDLLRADDMYVRAHYHCLRAMYALYDRGVLINPIILGEELRREGVLEQIGGISFVSELSYGLPHFSNLADYVTVVRGKSALRQLIKVCNRAISDALEEDDLPETILSNAGAAVAYVTAPDQFRLNPSRLDDWTSLAETAVEMRDLHYPHLFRKEHNSITSGYPELDTELGMSGFGFDELIVLAGRTSFGKTTYALNMSANAARSFLARGRGETVGFVSREMSRQRLFKRIHAMTCQIEAGLMRPGMWETTLKKLLASVDEVGRLPILIDERSSTLGQLRRQLHYGVTKRGMRICFVDYLQLMSAYTRRTGNRAAEVAEVARGLKELNKEFGIPVVALSQLSRDNLKEDRRPILSDLKESGEIEQAADTVIFIHGEEAERGERLRELQLIIAKQRDGIVHSPTQYIPLRFDTEMLTFHTPAFTKTFDKLAGVADDEEAAVDGAAKSEDWTM